VVVLAKSVLLGYYVLTLNEDAAGALGFLSLFAAYKKPQ